MSDETNEPEYVEIGGGHDADNSTLLLDAAESLDLDPSVVQTTSFGFRVPKSVADAAGLEAEEDQLAKEVAAEQEKADDELNFKTRGDAEKYAEANNITMDGASDMKADEYKEAVRKAALAKGE